MKYKTFQALHAVFLLSLFQIRIYSRANLRTGRCRTTFKILPFFWDFFKKLRLTCKAAALFCLPPQERFPTSSWSPGHYHWHHDHHHDDDWLWIKDGTLCRYVVIREAWIPTKSPPDPFITGAAKWSSLPFPLLHQHFTHTLINDDQADRRVWPLWSARRPSQGRTHHQMRSALPSEQGSIQPVGQQDEGCRKYQSWQIEGR